MKRFQLFAAMALIAVPAVAQGQPGDQGGDRQRGGGEYQRGDRPGGGDRDNYRYNRPPPGGQYWDHRRPAPRGGYWRENRWNQRPVYAPRYYYPRGYRYQRWSPGLILPLPFINSSYYFDDYNVLGLPQPRGYRWVRYGPDLVLVEIRTGRIREVRHGVFR